MAADDLGNAILRYIIELGSKQEVRPGEIKLAPMDDLASEMGVSRGKVREELLAAQAYGVVEMRPGDGTYVLPFDFYSGVGPLALYGIARDPGRFDALYRVRVAIETAFWDEATAALVQEDVDELRKIVARARKKLSGSPVEIPHPEHRRFHLRLFVKLNNPFVEGLLKAYWDAYEAVGLNRYFELGYYERMWSSHSAMIDAIVAGRNAEGRQALEEHFTLLEDRLQK